MATGQYKRQDMLASDLDTTVIQAAVTPGTTYTATTGSIDCRGFRQVDFFIHITGLGSIGSITVGPETGNDLGGTTYWSTFLAEDLDVETGIATTNKYQVVLDDPTPDVNVVYKVSVPVEGQHMRLQYKVNAVGGASAEILVIYARRRV
jgi:hypothetical protein